MTAADPPRVLVVVPTYNEVSNLPTVVERTLAADAEVDLLIVDGGSPDGTGRLADQLAEQRTDSGDSGGARTGGGLHVLHRPGKQGLGPAYRAGLGWGLTRGYDLLVEMDADLSHDPADLPRLLAASDRADVVIGSRYVSGGGVANWPWHRRALSAGGNRYVRALTGIPVADATSGYRVYRRAVLEEIALEHLTSDGYAFQLETVLRSWRAGFHVTEVPITFVERRDGTSKISRMIVAEALYRVLVWGLRGPRGSGGTHPRSVRT